MKPSMLPFMRVARSRAKRLPARSVPLNDDSYMGLGLSIFFRCFSVQDWQMKNKQASKAFK